MNMLCFLADHLHTYPSKIEEEMDMWTKEFMKYFKPKNSNFIEF